MNIPGLYLYDVVVSPKGERFAVSTVKLPEGNPLFKFHTGTYPADEKGEPDTDHPVRHHYGSDWEMAQRIHTDHINLVKGAK